MFFVVYVLIRKGESYSASLEGDGSATEEGSSSGTAFVESSGQMFMLLGSEDGCASGATMVLPADVLGTEYYASSWDPKEVNGMATLVIIATENNTVISIESAFIRKITRRISKAFESFTYQSEFDITGAHIRANHPVAVISGSSQMALGRTVDHFSYLHPVEQWGSQFVVPGVMSKMEYTVKIVTSALYTEVNIAGQDEFILSRGEFLSYTVTSKESIFIDATAPLQVVQYLLYRSLDSDLVYSSTYVPPVVRYASDYFFITPDFSSLYTHLALVVVETNHTSGVQLYGDQVFDWKPVAHSYPPQSVGTFKVNLIRSMYDFLISSQETIPLG